MNKLKITALWVFLITSLIFSNTGTAIEREFAFLNLNQIKTLDNPAPTDKLSLYILPNGWRVMNDRFLNEIDLRLTECDKREEIVDAVKDRIINNPSSIHFYQEPVFLAFGVPVVFTGGLILGMILAK